MKILFIVLFCSSFWLYSCKSQKAESINTMYDTPPEIGRLTTDLPKYNKIPVQKIIETTTIQPSEIDKSYLPQIIDTLSSSPITENEDVISSDTKTVIQTINTSAFSWEIGIRQTQILDVRTLEEFKLGHIYDAVNMNVDDPSFIYQIQKLDKNSPVAVYCRSGIRSLYAAKILQESGFTIIFNLEGGLNQWKKDRKELVK